MLMPAFVLGTALAAALMRHTRSAMLGVLQSDYVRTARAKGLRERVVILKHAFRNAVLPIVTLSALLFGELLAGAVLTEQIFTIPGFGKLIVDAVFNRDYAVVQGVVLCTAVGFILMNLLADVLYVLLNPRMRTAHDRRRRHAAVPPARRSRAGSKLRANRARWWARADRRVFVLLAVLAPVLPIADPAATDWGAIRKPPSAEHWLGTDEIGRDILSRMIWGAQASLLAGVSRWPSRWRIGVPFGLIAGYFGGWTDSIISRATDALLAMPFLILAIALAAFLGPSLTNAMIAIGLSAVPIFIRLTRGQVLASRPRITSKARAPSAGPSRIMAATSCPTSSPPIMVQATLTIATAIIAEASLSFLGLGQQPPAPAGARC
jgi:peptide/nickel transport system permease protein